MYVCIPLSIHMYSYIYIYTWNVFTCVHQCIYIQVLAKPGSVKPAKTFTAEIYCLSKEEGASLVCGYGFGCGCGCSCVGGWVCVSPSHRWVHLLQQGGGCVSCVAVGCVGVVVCMCVCLCASLSPVRSIVLARRSVRLVCLCVALSVDGYQWVWVSLSLRRRMRHVCLFVAVTVALVCWWA